MKRVVITFVCASLSFFSYAWGDRSVAHSDLIESIGAADFRIINDGALKEYGKNSDILVMGVMGHEGCKGSINTLERLTYGNAVEVSTTKYYEYGETLYSLSASYDNHDLTFRCSYQYSRSDGSYLYGRFSGSVSDK